MTVSAFGVIHKVDRQYKRDQNGRFAAMNAKKKRAAFDQQLKDFYASDTYKNNKEMFHFWWLLDRNGGPWGSQFYLDNKGRVVPAALRVWDDEPELMDKKHGKPSAYEVMTERLKDPTAFDGYDPKWSTPEGEKDYQAHYKAKEEAGRNRRTE